MNKPDLVLNNGNQCIVAQSIFIFQEFFPNLFKTLIGTFTSSLVHIIWGWRHVIFNLTCEQSAGLRSVVATLLRSVWCASGGQAGENSGVGVGLTNCYRTRTWIWVDPRKCQPLSIFYLAHTGYRLIVCVFQNYPPFDRDCRKREIGGKQRRGGAPPRLCPWFVC